MKRFEVTIERRVIVYALTADDASAKALDGLGFRGLSADDPRARVVGAAELPELLAEKHAPLIDRAPGMQK